MDRPNASAAKAALAVAVCLLAACNPSTPGTQDTVRVYTWANPQFERDNEVVGAPPNQLGGPWDTLAPPLAVPAFRPTPNLPKSIDQMNDQELVGFLNGLAYDRSAENSQLALFECEKKNLISGKYGPCNAKERQTVFVQPEMGMNRRPYDTIDTVRFGVIIARFINYDDRPHRRMKGLAIPAGTHAWWLVDTAGGKVRSRIIARTFDQAGKSYTVLKDGLGFVHCQHEETDQSRPAMARWWNCGSRLEIYSLQRRKAVVTAPPSLFRFVAARRFSLPEPPAPYSDVSLTGDGWATCGMGCCATQ